MEKFYAIVEFEDGLQIVPNNWLNGDLSKAYWPHFTNNSRYDKAVKCMEDPDNNWSQHSIRKIYGTSRKELYFLVIHIIIFFACKYWYF